MSEAALAPSPSERQTVASSRPRRSQLSSLEALERGFALFRSTITRQAWRYYLGTAPLILCFIPVWVINGQIRISDGALMMETALLGAAYALRVSMVASYMGRVRELAFGTPTSKPAGAAAQAAFVGRLLTWKIMLSACALITLPSVAGAPWFYSASQFASLEAREDSGERHSFSGCLALASQWFGGGVLLFLMLFPLWIAVWLSGLILATILPQLLHSIFGLNTLLSTQMGIFALVQSSAFWLALFAGAWLAFDPIVKCTFVIVYQHLRSRREGDDLRGLLASLPREQQTKQQRIAFNATGGRVRTGALFILAVILTGACLTATSRATQVPPGSTPELGNSPRQVRIQRLRQALEQESGRAIYRWHDAEHPNPPTWFDKLMDKIGQAIGRSWNRLWNFLGKLWPRGLSLSPGNQKHGDWQLKDLRLWVALVAILTIAAAAVLFWLRQRRTLASLSLPLEVTPIPDIGESAAATDRSEDEWFQLASRLEREGELRLALRAAYLGLLAGLAEREWLTIRRDRTNREYLHEFTRRWLRRPQASVEARTEVPEKIRGSLRQFDQVWYGSHGVTPQAVATYLENQRELLNHV